jgi:hypothetical protein
MRQSLAADQHLSDVGQSSTIDRGRMPAGAILRVGGSKKGVKAYLQGSTLKPHRIYLKGEPTSPGSKTLAKSSYFLVCASNAPESDFPLQIRETARFLRRHMRDLRRLAKHGLHAEIDFAVTDDRSSSGATFLFWYIPKSFIRLLDEAAIDAKISFL